MLPKRPETSAIGHGYVTRRVDRYRRGEHEQVSDAITEEVPVAMVYNDVPFAVMMVTPLDLEDFALGFSLSEGLVGTQAELKSIEVRPRLEGVELAMQVVSGTIEQRAGSGGERLLPGRSGCGLCGARMLEDAVRHPAAVGEGRRIESAALERALDALRAAQPVNAATGSVHAAAWCCIDGGIAMVREDVGRHNALDKLIGAMVKANVDPEQGFLVVTSRASYEMVTKAASAGITFMAAISAPTALAIHLAESTHLTLVGFARPGHYVVYTHPQRLLHTAGVRA
ncbi:formate dehydrogenase accessory sulfurtransferase FdhD [Dyella caseinilytica]|uniref:Sulfur carrier protein FdhD n=1 Tax=Dyella caseinilytica TaxID=1849581 RepID=A0ABX7GPJ7_9GAMM|nr:formate dehydrogenase accessory sulfurtransferase FdhD [Dyella caseinilytica]QRN52342.1 formate dehydrogenase accessory sulfurtransferase FdhD [Dyella caseinilytica]GGA14958.1 sulfurtransferase FdhD [Dyella caseinilytica]